MALPLEGITVLSIEHAVAAPFATRQLADLGARVIKIERPDGGDFARGYDATVKGQSSYFVWLNRSKESLTLDLKRPVAKGILARLLRRADVFVQNLGPGAAQRLGVDAPELRGRYPKLIIAAVSGYGQAGPYASKKAYDLLVQSEVGLVSITGTEDTPSRVGISVADVAAGMYTFSGILSALYARANTGEGATLDISLFDALAEWMGPAAYYTEYGGTPPHRSGPHHASIAPYGPFETRAGGTVYLAVQSAREWVRFCETVLQMPELAEDPKFHTNALRVQNRAALHAIVSGVLSSLTRADVLARLDHAHIASARMNSMAEFLAHPQISSRDRWTNITTPAGPVRAMLPPVQWEGVSPVMGAVPALGQHNDQILGELGFPPEKIEAWRKDGTI